MPGETEALETYLREVDARLDLLPDARARELAELRARLEASARELGSPAAAVRRAGPARAVAARLNRAHQRDGLRLEARWGGLLKLWKGRTPWTDKAAAVETTVWALAWAICAWVVGAGVWIWPAWWTWLYEPIWNSGSRASRIFTGSFLLLTGQTMISAFLAPRLAPWISRREALAFGRAVVWTIAGGAAATFAYFIGRAAAACRCFPTLTFWVSAIFVGGFAALAITSLRSRLRPLQEGGPPR